jgi:hypothetical protein
MRVYLPTVLFLLALFLVAPGASAQLLPFRILKQERQKIGGSMQPLRSPKYVLLIVRAAITEHHPELTKENVGATLHALLQTVRDETNRPGAQVDGITVFLYQSADHIKGGDAALGNAEWWPKGHSFDPGNAVNIENKATHVESIEVFRLPTRMFSVVSRLPEAKRREIFSAVLRLEDQAKRKAEAKYPLDASKITLEDALSKQSKEEERLHNQYEQSLLQKYKISKSELEKIKVEALEQQWPSPVLQ